MTTEEAKAVLLGAASRAGPLDVTRRNPWEGVLVAFLLGCLAGSDRDARSALRESLHLFLKVL